MLCFWRLLHRRLTAGLAVTVASAVIITAAPAAVGAQHDVLSDIADSVHKPGIDALDNLGLFEGTLCGDGEFCPQEPIKRSTMAVWLIRALSEQPAAAGATRFADIDADGPQTPYIERLAELEITTGCKTDPLHYCPDTAVTRAQMATFLVRALRLEPAEPVGFADIGGSTHAGSIDRVAASGVTASCETSPLRYCPDAAVTRAQMATFLRPGRRADRHLRA